MRLEPLKEDNLYTGENPHEFILVPKSPLIGGFTVVGIIQNGTGPKITFPTEVLRIVEDSSYFSYISAVQDSAHLIE